MLGRKPASTHVNVDVKNGKGEGPQVNKEAFPRLIEKLIYMNHTHLDISFAINSLSQFMNEPCENHLVRITIGGGLLFTRNGDLSVETYINVDYVNSVMDRSTSRYCAFLGGSLITWHSQ